MFWRAPLRLVGIGPLGSGTLGRVASRARSRPAESVLRRGTVVAPGGSTSGATPAWGLRVLTTVSVPDRGGAYMGGHTRAQSGRSRFGAPGSVL